MKITVLIPEAFCLPAKHLQSPKGLAFRPALVTVPREAGCAGVLCPPCALTPQLLSPTSVLVLLAFAALLFLSAQQTSHLNLTRRVSSSQLSVFSPCCPCSLLSLFGMSLPLHLGAHHLDLPTSPYVSATSQLGDTNTSCRPQHGPRATLITRDECLVGPFPVGLRSAGAPLLKRQKCSFPSAKITALPQNVQESPSPRPTPPVFQLPSFRCQFNFHFEEATFGSPEQLGILLAAPCFC